jgi:hypothetical protein
VAAAVLRLGRNSQNKCQAAEYETFVRGFHGLVPAWSGSIPQSAASSTLGADARGWFGFRASAGVSLRIIMSYASE